MKTKFFILFIFLFIPITVFGQILSIDGFEDGNFHQNPIWKGDTLHFRVIRENNNHLLRLDAPSGGVSSLSTSQSDIIGIWDFFVRLDFSPSSSNKVEIILMSDNEDLEGNFNGYGILIGQSGNNDYATLYRYDNGNPTEELITDTLAFFTGGDLHIQVERQRNGIWLMVTSNRYDEYPLLWSNPVEDTTYNVGPYFGFITSYTSSRKDLFYFDFAINIPSFSIEEINSIDTQILQVLFSINVDTTMADISNFTLDNGISSSRLEWITQQNLYLYYQNPLLSGLHTLHIENIFSFNGEEISNVDSSFYIFDSISFGDVVINELLYNANNEIGEFIELYNYSSKVFNTDKWSIQDASESRNIFPSLVLFPQSYIIVKSSSNQIVLPQDVIEINYSDFINLNQSSDIIVLINDKGQIIDSVFYFSNWGGSKGVSLERIDPRAASNDNTNWGSSTNRETGHSAGKVNSIFKEDSSSPNLEFAFYDNRKLKIQFNEFINSQTLNGITLVQDGRSIEISKEEENISNEFYFLLDEDIIRQKTSLQIFSVEDVKGNQATDISIPVSFFPKEGSIIFNEIMYDPIDSDNDGFPNQSEYIEIFNRADYAISLESVLLYTGRNEIGEYTSLDIENGAKWVNPQEYALIYPYRDGSFSSSIANFFEIPSGKYEHSVVSVSSLGLGQEDQLWLANIDGAILDSLFYTQDWHSSHLISTKGISLERISHTVATNISSNWGSSVNKLGGSPLKINSIRQENINETTNKEGIFLSPNPFSPDFDGRDDRLFIRYVLDKPDYILTIRIFDRYGRLVRSLVEQQISGFKGSFVWDGLMGGGQMLPIGLYVILLDANHPEEKSRRSFKSVVAIARK